MAAKVTLTLTGTGYTSEVDLKDQTILRILNAGSWTTADLYVEERIASGTYAPLYDDEGNRVTIAMGATRMVRVDERLFQHARAVRFQSSNSQGAERTLVVQTVRLSELAYGTPS